MCKKLYLESFAYLLIADVKVYVMTHTVTLASFQHSSGWKYYVILSERSYIDESFLNNAVNSVMVGCDTYMAFRGDMFPTSFIL